MLYRLMYRPLQVRPLVGLLPSLQLDVFSVRQEERAFGALLHKVSEQMFRHADDEELVAQVRACVRLHS